MVKGIEQLLYSQFVQTKVKKKMLTPQAGRDEVGYIRSL